MAAIERKSAIEHSVRENECLKRVQTILIEAIATTTYCQHNMWVCMQLNNKKNKISLWFLLGVTAVREKYMRLELLNYRKHK